ncbi:MAG: hypothetical protein KIS66_11830 [Fimbriimonadaceae bacterium]|nr:hypothetical protein [Fimbriimonadaceae bacterium]
MRRRWAAAVGMLALVAATAVLSQEARRDPPPVLLRNYEEAALHMDAHGIEVHRVEWSGRWLYVAGGVVLVRDEDGVSRPFSPSVGDLGRVWVGGRS